MRQIWRQSIPTVPKPNVSEQSPYKLQPQPQHLEQPIHQDYIEDDTMEEAQRDHDNFDEVADIARRSYKLVKEVMGELNVEYKMLQQISTEFQPTWDDTTGAAMVLLNSCAQGVTEASRTGDRIKISNFWMAGQIYSNSTTRAFPVRCIVYWQPGADTVNRNFYSSAGPPPTQDGLLDVIAANDQLAISAPKDYDNENKTEILYDHTWIVNQLGQPGSVHQFKHLIKLMRHTQYQVNSSTINNGVLRITFLGNAATADTTRPFVTFMSRVYFVDN